MALSAEPGLDSLVERVLASGSLPGLPEQHYIGGRFVPSASGARMETFDPARGAAFASFAAGNADDVGAAVQARSAVASCSAPPR